MDAAHDYPEVHFDRPRFVIFLVLGGILDVARHPPIRGLQIERERLAERHLEARGRGGTIRWAHVDDS